MKAKRKELPFVSFKGETYKPGDCVLINPDAYAPAYIARIRKFVQLSLNPIDVEVEVTWYYRPEEALGGRKVFHGTAEVLDSDHQDKAPLAAIIGRCTIHSLEAFESLPTRLDTDFFCRFKYKPKTKQFEPEQVPVYCICELPYNPDKPMIKCDTCLDWFHPHCLRMGPEVLREDAFQCPSCNPKRLRVGPSTNEP